ncbi:MAG: DUF805 domain-containing protein [Planctomycetes bacterium]|nr:DUF805 domain-containing protein [Planctomycetota bacterium]
MLGLQRPLGRLPYLLAGVSLFALKAALDAAVCRAYGRPWSALLYVSPIDAPLFRPRENLGYWLALWVVALPFIAVGLLLTLRRLRDAGLPGWLAALFFVPFANLLFFVACAAFPPRRSEPVPDRRLGSRRGANREFGAAISIGGVVGAVVGLGAVGISVGLLRRYGTALFLGAPVLAGYASACAFGRLHAATVTGALLSAAAALLYTGLILALFAVDGLVCLAMAIPLVLVGALVGAFVGWSAAERRGTIPGAPLALLPLLFLAESLSPLRRPEPRPVETAVIVDAPPEVVWNRVVAFPPLPPPTEILFRLGVAAPMAARIEGEGVGAVRRCVFTTGEFVEPIEVWDPGRELAFSVLSQPDPMRELTLWRGARPPHLDGYLESTRGQFLLEALPDGRTRLVGRTWYRTNMAPEGYWRLWADAFIEAIHLRVLRHVAALAEVDARRK